MIGPSAADIYQSQAPRERARFGDVGYQCRRLEDGMEALCGVCDMQARIENIFGIPNIEVVNSLPV